MTSFKSYKIPVDSVSLSNINRAPSNYLEMTLQVFPLDHDRFNRTAISTVGFMLSNQTFKPPSDFGPFYFTANGYTTFAGNSMFGKKSCIIHFFVLVPNWSFLLNIHLFVPTIEQSVPGSRKILSMTAIIAIAVVGAAVLLVPLCIVTIICCRKKRSIKTVDPDKTFGKCFSFT